MVRTCFVHLIVAVMAIDRDFTSTAAGHGSEAEVSNPGCSPFADAEKCLTIYRDLQMH